MGALLWNRKESGLKKSRPSWLVGSDKTMGGSAPFIGSSERQRDGVAHRATRQAVRVLLLRIGSGGVRGECRWADWW